MVVTSMGIFLTQRQDDRSTMQNSKVILVVHSMDVANSRERNLVLSHPEIQGYN